MIKIILHVFLLGFTLTSYSNSKEQINIVKTDNGNVVFGLTRAEVKNDQCTFIVDVEKDERIWFDQGWTAFIDKINNKSLTNFDPHIEQSRQCADVRWVWAWLSPFRLEVKKRITFLSLWRKNMRFARNFD